jgi:hypothetical protein
VLFLNKQTQDWKDKYIHSFTSLSGAFGGSIFAATALVSLIPEFNSELPEASLREMMRQWGKLKFQAPY